jgi:hypothetical protein
MFNFILWKTKDSRVVHPDLEAAILSSEAAHPAIMWGARVDKSGTLNSGTMLQSNILSNIRMIKQKKIDLLIIS